MHGRLAEQLQRPPTLNELVENLSGAYPTIVAQVLEDAGLSFSASGKPHETRRYAVELHPLDFEWYFTRETAAAVARRISWDASVLCLGTPTVASELARQRRRVTLIDRNALVTRRFEELAFAKVVSADLMRTRRLPRAVDAIVLDAPWYQRDISVWLRSAWVASRCDSTIYMSLFPQNVRPEAWRERKRLLAFAERIGDVQIEPTALHYETPLFEQEALRAADMLGLGDWRRGDLVSIRVSAEAPRRYRVLLPRATPQWETIVIGTQVVKMKRTRASRRGPLVASVPGCPGDVLPTVSARDRRRKIVGLWTSRNRVLSVNRPKVVAALLRQVEVGASLAEAAGEMRRLGIELDAPSLRKLDDLFRD